MGIFLQFHLLHFGDHQTHSFFCLIAEFDTSGIEVLKILLSCLVEYLIIGQISVCYEQIMILAVFILGDMFSDKIKLLCFNVLGIFFFISFFTTDRLLNIPYFVSGNIKCFFILCFFNRVGCYFCRNIGFKLVSPLSVWILVFILLRQVDNIHICIKLVAKVLLLFFAHGLFKLRYKSYFLIGC